MELKNMSEKKKYKVVLSDAVKAKIKTLNTKDKKIINDAIERISKNPFIGKPVDWVQIESWANEICHTCKGGCFEEPINMLLDKNSNEITCTCPLCGESFWMRKSELIAGRKKYLANMRKNIFKIKKGSAEIKQDKKKLKITKK